MVVKGKTQWRPEELLLRLSCPHCSLLYGQQGAAVQGQRSGQQWETLGPDWEGRGPQNGAWLQGSSSLVVSVASA